MQFASISAIDGPLPEPWSIENYAYGIEKLQFKNQVSEKFLDIEVNLIIH